MNANFRFFFLPFSVGSLISPHILLASNNVIGLYNSLVPGLSAKQVLLKVVTKNLAEHTISDSTKQNQAMRYSGSFIWWNSFSRHIQTLAST